MCVIILKNGGVDFPADAIRMAQARNAHGFGYMYFDKKTGRLVTNKGTNFSTEEVLTTIDNLKDVDLALHFRIKTVGEINDQNCHPFKVLSIDDGDPVDIYMMHNGTITGITPDAGETDTAAFIRQIVKPLLSYDYEILHDDAFKTLITSFVNKSRLLFMTSQDEVVIINEEEGAVKHDAWVSNSWTFLPRTTTTGASSSCSTTYTSKQEAEKKNEPSKSLVVLDFIDETIQLGDTVGIWHDTKNDFYAEGRVVANYTESVRVRFVNTYGISVEIGFRKSNGESFGAVEQYYAMSLTETQMGNVIPLPVQKKSSVSEETTTEEPSTDESVYAEEEPDYQNRYGGAFLQDSWETYEDTSIRDVYEMSKEDRIKLFKENPTLVFNMFQDLLELFCIQEDEDEELRIESSEVLKA